MVEKEVVPGGEDTTLQQLQTFLEQGKLKEAKTLLRSQPTKDIAGTWKAILEHHTRGSPVDTATIYWDTVDTCFGGRDPMDSLDKIPSCVESSHTPDYAHNKQTRAEVCRLVTCLAYNCPDITYSPLIFPCAAILRRHLSEEDSYAALSILVEPPRGFQFLTQSRKSWEILCQTFYPLAQKFIKKQLTRLEAVVDKNEMQSVFVNWPWWVFENAPVKFIETMFSSFLLEGNKILYRFALGMVKAYAKHNFDASSIKEEGYHKIGFKIARFSRADVSKMTLRVEMELKSVANIDSGGVGARRRSNLELITPDAANDIVALSDTLSYKQGMSTPQPKPKTSTASVFSIHHLKSEILNKNDLSVITCMRKVKGSIPRVLLQKLWQLLPERITMIKPKLVFSSNTDGTSLRTFYLKSEYYEPTILLIKTRDGDVFGAYCSSTWRERNEKDERGLKQMYFGTGETFLFRFVPGRGEDGEEVVKYVWVGEGKEMEGRGDRAEQLFMSADDTMISVGGGEGTGIFLDGNLEYGRTETCKTFQNPPLAGNKDFSISVVEVIGFNDTKW